METQNRNQDFYEHAPVMYASLDHASGTIIECNQTLLQETGYSKEEIQGRSVLELYSQDSRASAEKIFEDLKQTGEITSHHLQFQGKNGHPLEVDFTASAVRDGSGGVRHYRASWQNITKQVNLEESLRESEDRFQSLVEAIPQQVWTAKPDGALDYVNHRVTQYFNRSFEQMIGWGWKEVLHPEDLPECLRRWTRALQTGDPYEIEFRLRRASDGAYLWHLGRALPVRGQDGRIVKWFGTNTDISAHRDSEEALRGSEERYRALYDNNPSMYFTVAQDGTVLSVNRFGAKQLGFTIEELVGQSVWNIVHEVDRQEVQEKFAQCMKTPTLVRHWEFRKVCKNGQVMWVKEVVKVVQGRDGNLLVLMVCDDITDRKRTEEALRESEGRFRSVAQSANDAIISADDRGLIVSWNKGAHTMFGYEEQEVVGKPLTVLMPERYWKAHREGLKRLQDTGKSTLKGRTLELNGLRKNKTEFPLELVISFWDLRGKSYFTGIIRDITDRKRVEEALQEAHDSLERRVEVRTKELRETNHRLSTEIWERKRTEEELRISEERFRDLYDSAPLAYFSAATDGIIWKANAQASELFGYSPNELIGRHVLDLYAPTADGKEKARQLIIEGEEIVGEVLEAQRADGTILWLDLTVRFIRNAQGRPLERRAMLKDITERRRLEEQIRQYTEELERMVAERTDQIRKLEVQRMQSEKLAALGQLAAGVAHEINNPLAGVSNGFLLIKEAIPTEHPMYPYVDIVDQGLTRVTEIIENMYKLYGGGLKEGWLMPADKVLKDVLQILAKQMKEREISVIKEIPAGLPDILILETELAQVITNLLQNAIDASPNGGTIRVTVKSVGDTLRIEVADGGVGISPEVVSRIFEPFFTTKTGRPKSSMGLGLSVSNSLVEAMGGRIEVESKMGEGSTFTVVLPLEQKENNGELREQKGG